MSPLSLSKSRKVTTTVEDDDSCKKQSFVEKIAAKDPARAKFIKDGTEEELQGLREIQEALGIPKDKMIDEDKVRSNVEYTFDKEYQRRAASQSRTSLEDSNSRSR